MEFSLKEQIEKLTHWAEEKKAENISVYDVEGKNDYTDAILVCEGSGELHNRAIADHIIRQAKEEKIYILGKEGYNKASWILIDMVNIIIHIFDHDTRKYYDLEKLWAASRKIRQKNKNVSITQEEIIE